LPRPLVKVELNGRPTEFFDSESAVCDEYPSEMVMYY
jgi:hypothetical protein